MEDAERTQSRGYLLERIQYSMGLKIYSVTQFLITDKIIGPLSAKINYMNLLDLNELYYGSTPAASTIFMY
jgi:hypothetical protein